MNILELHDITHGNLTCQNIMIGNDDLLKICDIGIMDFIERKDYFVRWTAPEVLLDSNKLVLVVSKFVFVVVVCLFNFCFCYCYWCWCCCCRCCCYCCCCCYCLLLLFIVRVLNLMFGVSEF